MKKTGLYKITLSESPSGYQWFDFVHNLDELSDIVNSFLIAPTIHYIEACAVLEDSDVLNLINASGKTLHSIKSPEWVYSNETILNAIKALASMGQTIDAIKLFRAFADVGLKEAKDYIDSVYQESTEEKD